MIDWITAVIPCSNFDTSQLQDGKFCKVRPDGGLEWEKEIGKDIPGSYDSNIRVSNDQGCYSSHIRIDGNPAKWLQGHNLFGSNDLIGLVKEVLCRLTLILDLRPSENDIRLWETGCYLLKRVDCTEMWVLPRKEDVFAWLHAAQFQAKSRCGKGVMSGNTLYFQKNSRRWALKFYSKGEEISIKGHTLPTDIPHYQNLHNFAENKLRGEVVLRRPQLEKLGLDYAVNWKVETPYIMLREHLGRLDMSDQFNLTIEKIHGLTPRLQMTYASWMRGDDLRSILPKTSFYRYRRELLEFGVDISVSKPNENRKPILLTDVLKKEPASTPDWALGSEIFFVPEISYAMG